MKEYIISDGHSTRAGILPEKGATVVSLCKNGKEFLYRDQENLDSPERPRCGIPFLFPIFGRLADGVYQRDGKQYAMEIHGFGHTSQWAVVSQEDDALTLELQDSPETLAMYPFRFRTELEFRVSDGLMTIRQRFENRDEKPMPYNFGFHPYFRVTELEQIQVETTAQNYFDFVAGKNVEFGHGCVGVTLPAGAPETGAAFMGVTGPTILHNPKDGLKVTLENDGNYPQNVLWTQAGKEFLCVEPINGTANGLNTGVYRVLEPGQIAEANLKIRIELI